MCLRIRRKKRMEMFNVSPGVAVVGGILTGLVALFIYNKVTGD